MKLLNKSRMRIIAFIMAVVLILPVVLMNPATVNASSINDSPEKITLPLIYNMVEKGTIDLYIWNSTYYLSIEDLCDLVRAEQTVEGNSIVVKQGIWPVVFNPDRNTFDDGYQHYEVKMLEIANNQYAVPAIMFLSYFKAVTIITETKVYCEMKDATAWEVLDVDYKNTLIDIYEFYGGEGYVAGHLACGMLMDLLLGNLTDLEAYLSDAYDCVLRVDLNDYNSVRQYIEERNETLQEKIESGNIAEFVQDFDKIYSLSGEPVEWYIDFYYHNLEKDFVNLAYAAKSAGKQADFTYYSEMFYEAFDEKNKAQEQAGAIVDNKYADYIMILASAALATAQDVKYTTATNNIIYEVMAPENVKKLGISVDDELWYELAYNYKNTLGIAAQNIEEEAEKFYVDSYETFLSILAQGASGVSAGVYSWSLELGRFLVEEFPLTSSSISQSKADMRAMFLSDLQQYVYRVLYNSIVKLNEDRGSEKAFEKIILANQLYCRTSIAMYENLIKSLDGFTSNREEWVAFFQNRIDYLAVKMYQLTTLQGDAIISCLPMDLRTFAYEDIIYSAPVLSTSKKLTSVIQYFPNENNEYSFSYNEDGQIAAITGTSGDAEYGPREIIYDSEGRAVKIWTPSHEWAGWQTYTYNSAGQLISKIESEGSSTESIYTYDSQGNMTHMTQNFDFGIGEYELKSNTSGQVVSVYGMRNLDDGSCYTDEYNISYDSEGRLSEILGSFGGADYNLSYDYNYKPFVIETYSGVYKGCSLILQDKMAHTLWLIGIPNNSQISLDEDGYLSKISGHYSYGEDVVITFLYDGESETDLSLQSSSSSDGYSDILEQYQIAEQNGFQNCGEYVGDSIQYLSNWGSSFEVYYSKFDMNDDGVSELLIGAKDANYSDEISMYDFYTVNDGNPIRLVSTASLGHRAHLFIFQDGTFAVDGSGGASTHSTEFYELQHYATTATLISGHGTDMGEPYYLESSGNRRPISMDEYNELPNVTDFPQLQISWQRLQ